MTLDIDKSPGANPDGGVMVVGVIAARSLPLATGTDPCDSGGAWTDAFEQADAFTAADALRHCFPTLTVALGENPLHHLQSSETWRRHTPHPRDAINTHTALPEAWAQSIFMPECQMPSRTTATSMTSAQGQEGTEWKKAQQQQQPPLQWERVWGPKRVGTVIKGTLSKINIRRLSILHFMWFIWQIHCKITSTLGRNTFSSSFLK